MAMFVVADGGSIYLNLERATSIRVPVNANIGGGPLEGRWPVLAKFGPKETLIDSAPSRAEALVLASHFAQAANRASA